MEDLALAESFYTGLPHVDADTNTVLDEELSLEELYTAAMSLGTLTASLLSFINLSGQWWVEICWRCSRKVCVKDNCH